MSIGAAMAVCASMDKQESPVAEIGQISTTSMRLRKWQAMELAARGGVIMPPRPMADLSIRRNSYCSAMVSSPSSDEMVAMALLYYLGPVSLEDIKQVIPEGRWLASMKPLIEQGLVLVLDEGRSERAADMRLAGSWEIKPVAGRPASPRPPTRREAVAVCRWCAEMVRARRIEADAAAFGTLGWFKQSALGVMSPRKTLPRKRELLEAVDEIAKWQSSTGIMEPAGWPVTRLWLRSVSEHPYAPEIVPFWPEGT